ncbi:hypothetical protein [Lacihabitans soyangensis]|uniref:Uncharacterized protein n=1 Tax=Lacihabitans soyangensis TaxID=869394 RepID=A0AAE3KQS9_9BACT|nr:hypothetical protein [Lacihabitans soyangensis]MCP9761393.1 hypothetical protein [Lacihabitans soyangensis]
MVISPDIFNNLVLKKDFRDQKDADYLISLCKAYPNFKLPFILLLNYQPDFFNQEYWKKGEELILNSKSNWNAYLRVEGAEAHKAGSKMGGHNNGKCVDQKAILQKYLSKDTPSFI